MSSFWGGALGQLKEHWTESPETQTKTNNNNNNNNNNRMPVIERSLYARHS